MREISSVGSRCIGADGIDGKCKVGGHGVRRQLGGGYLLVRIQAQKEQQTEDLGSSGIHR